MAPLAEATQWRWHWLCALLCTTYNPQIENNVSACASIRDESCLIRSALNAEIRVTKSSIRCRLNHLWKSGLSSAVVVTAIRRVTWSTSSGGASPHRGYDRQALRLSQA
jgi:hypothetical protein